MNIPQKIAVIGPTQSGKTCLAIGLFSTSTHGFTIATPNMDDRNYLVDRRKEIVGGEWPAANIKGRPHPLRFDFQKKGHDSITVTFPEFAGELLGTDEEFKALANEHFSDLSGVVLLINPGADAFQKGDTGLLEEAKTQYQRILSFLKDPNNGSDKAFVALTVTAADRLYGLDADLRGKDAAFRDCLEEIENTLSSSNFRWEKFFVSMSGPTGADNKFKRKSVPKGFPNTSSKPFLWILDKLFWLPIRAAFLRRLALVGGVAAALLAAAGVGCWINASEARRFIREEKAAASKELEAAGSTAGSCERAFDAAKPHLDSLNPGRYTRFWHKGLAASTYNELEPKAWDVLQRCIQRSREDLREDVRQNPTNCVDRTKGIDGIFAKFSPATDALRTRRDELKKDWDKEKVGLDEQIAIAVMTGSIGKKLDECTGKHGDDVLDSLNGLYSELSKVNPSDGATNLIQRRAALADELDKRVAYEWTDYAIPHFAQAASTGATDAAVRSLVERLKAWNPVTTNAMATKDELLSAVSSSIPKWRTSYEENRIRTSADSAVQSRDMAKMALLFPKRVATNEYLAASFVESVWSNTVKTAFEKARQKFIGEVVDNAARRRGNGKPELKEEDNERIKNESNRVGSPLDLGELLAEIQQRIKGKSDEWVASKRKECEDWVRDHVRADRKRAGQNSLWNEYVSFWRANSEDNPFVKTIVRTAVYTQCQKWFLEDCGYFNRALVSNPLWANSQSLPANFRDLEDKFNAFSMLCGAVAKDENPDKESWAYWFAKDCVEKGNVRDGIFLAFPQTLVVDKIEGNISYYDAEKKKDRFPSYYKRTSFAARVDVVRRNSDGSVSDSRKTILLPFEGNEKDAKNDEKNACDEKTKAKAFVIEPIRISIHAFEEVKLTAVVTDWIKWGGVKMQPTSHQGKSFFLSKPDYSYLLKELQNIDLSFHLGHSDGIGAHDDQKPKLGLSIGAHIEGDSIGDFMAKAMSEAAREKRGN